MTGNPLFDLTETIRTDEEFSVDTMRRIPLQRWAEPGEHTDAVRDEWGYTVDDIVRLRDEGAIGPIYRSPTPPGGQEQSHA